MTWGAPELLEVTDRERQERSAAGSSRGRWSVSVGVGGVVSGGWGEVELVSGAGKGWET